jgi:hypothetical protein
MATAAPDPFEEDLARILADEEVMAEIDERIRRVDAGEGVTHTHEEVLARLRRLGVRRPTVNEADDSSP